MRYLLKFSYDGTNYNGYQNQPGMNTIQGCLEAAVQKVNNGLHASVVATGRTDKGVHALSQYAHVDLIINITEKKLKRALNSNLPSDIHIIEAKIVDDNFHARYYVKEKEYKYYINIGEYNPLERNYIFQYNHDLDIKQMEKAIKYFLGEHDFRAFVTENKDKENCIRTITKSTIEEINGKIVFTFRGSGFLRYQIRNMVGLLIRVGENKIFPETVEKILESKDRTKSGKTAPPEGLYLTEITFN